MKNTCFVLYLVYFVNFTLEKRHHNIKLTLKEEVVRPVSCWVITALSLPAKL